MHALAQWAQLSTTRAGEPALESVDAPPLGDLEPDALRAVVAVLDRHTADATCWFAVWQGWGDFQRPRDSGAQFATPGREYYLFTGPVQAATRFGSWRTSDWYVPRSPNLFWPGDHSWCVASEIDFDSTLIGGPAQLIEDVLASDELEAWPIGPDDSLAWDADVVNRAESPRRDP